MALPSESSVPTALNLQEKFADTMQTLFVAPAQSMTEIQALGVERDWFETNAMWTNESPLHPTTRYPAFALLSAEGRVLMEGSAAEQEQRIHDYLNDQRRS